MIGSISAGWPYKWTGKIAATRRPMRRLIRRPSPSRRQCALRYSRNLFTLKLQVVGSTSTNSGRARACTTASAVAIKLLGTVITACPAPIPAASKAKRRASVPLLTPMQWRVPQNSAKPFSNCSSMGPLVNTAVLKAWLTTARISSCSSRCGLTRSRNGTEDVRSMIAPLKRAQITENSCRITRHDAVAGNIFGDHASGAHYGVFANGHTAQDGGAGAEGGSPAHHCRLYLPILLAFQASGGRGGTRVNVVDEDHTVADKHAVFDGDPLANETVAGDLATPAHLGVLLDFDEGADLGFVPNFAAVQIDEPGQADPPPQFHIRRHAAEFVHK